MSWCTCACLQRTSPKDQSAWSGCSCSWGSPPPPAFPGLAIETGVVLQDVSWYDLRDHLPTLSSEDGNALSAWTTHVTPGRFHTVHDFWVARIDGDPEEELLAASNERTHLLDLDASGSWEALRLGPRFNGPDIRGAGPFP